MNVGAYGVGGSGGSRPIEGPENLDPESQTAATTPAGDGQPMEATVSRQPTTGGPVMDLAAARLLGRIGSQLASVEGKGPKFLGGLDGTRNVAKEVDRLTREHSPANPIGAEVATELIRKAKDFKQITRDEFRELANFVEAYPEKFEPPALEALQLFISTHAPDGTFGRERNTREFSANADPTSSIWQKGRPSWEQSWNK